VSKPAVFLDRDGVLVEEVFYPETGEWEAPLRPEDVQLTSAATAALRTFASIGFAMVVISNQGGYTKGKTSLRTLWLAHERFLALLADEGAPQIDRCFYAYGHPEGVVPHFSGPSLDRKPGPYNVFIAAAQLDLDLARSWMVGDRESDIACAQAAGVCPILIDNLHSPMEVVSSVIRCKHIGEAAKLIQAKSVPAEV
jgi:D-glycero-D-manno-heptose 1,7-bisphosphate phosphatase